MLREQTSWPVVIWMGLLLSLALKLDAQTAPTLDATIIAEQRELDRRLIVAHEERSTDQVLALFAESADVFFIAPNGTLYRGRKGMRESYDRFFAGLESIRGEIKEVSYVRVGDGVIAVGTVVFHRQPKNSAADQKTVVWTDYRRVEGGRWVYLFRHAHWPVPAPNPPATPGSGPAPK